MATQATQPISIETGNDQTVSGLLTLPRSVRWLVVLAHGAGAGMTHPFMTQVADGLAARGVGCLRYQFRYMEAGSKRPDPPAVAHAIVRSAVAAASRLAPGVALVAGGKSFGGRMTSQAAAEAGLPNVRGLVFLGFPLHPAGKPSVSRAEHLERVGVPMLFLQGARDALADLDLLRPIVARIGAALVVSEGADHGFHVPKRSGRTDAQVLDAALDALVSWLDGLPPA